MRTVRTQTITLSAAVLAGAAAIAFTQPASACGLHTVALTGHTQVAQAVQTVPVTPRVRDQKEPTGNGAADNGAAANGGTAGANGSAGAGASAGAAGAGAGEGAGGR